MKVRRTVFDSLSEREVFRALETRWSRLALYPSLPLAKIVALEDGDELSQSERRYFYATNVDYTFCEADGRPLLSVEFDGMGHGFSRDGVYVEGRSTIDPNRAWKLNFKLGVARKTFYPLVVVSFDEVVALDEGESLTVLDGIIGQFLARRDFHRRVQREVEEAEGELGAFEGSDMLVEDLVLGVEVQTELENDVIARLGAEEHVACSRLGVQSHSIHYLTDPPLPDSGTYPPPPSELAARIAGMENAVRHGCRVVIQTPVVPIIRVAWVRNLGGEIGVSPTSIAESIATYLGFKQAHDLLEKHGGHRAPEPQSF